MKPILILFILALTACAPAPTELPENFNAEFEF